MIRAAPALLLAIALALGSVLYLQSQAGAPDRPEDAVRAHGRSRATPALRQPAPADHATAWVATILARPLFSPQRRPSETVATAKATGPEMPRLTGVLVSEAGSGAIFAQAGEKPIVAKAGDRVGPFLIRSISVGQVIVQGPAGLVTLHPVFAAAPSDRGVLRPASGQPSLLDKLRARPQAPIPLPSPSVVQSLFQQQQAKVEK